MVDLIELTLNHGMFIVRAVQTLAEADSQLAEWHPQLVVLDMDHDDSTALLGRLGASDQLTKRGTPALGLTRRGDLKTKLRAFDLGVDDILTMPFSPEELLARSIVITRRAAGTDLPLIPTITLGEMEIDILSREVRTGSSVIHLSGIEQSLLYLLASRSGRVVTRDEILDAVWGTDFVAESNIVDRHIRTLRDQAPERLPPSALHRDRPRPGLPVHSDVLEPGLGRRRGRGRQAAGLIASLPAAGQHGGWRYWGLRLRGCR